MGIKGKARKTTKKDILPKYVRMGMSERGTCLRLDGDEYWRDGGQWGVEYRFVGEQLISWNPPDRFHPQFNMPWLHKVPLIEVTEEVWRKDNALIEINEDSLPF